RPFECFEAEVRDELSAPLVERGARLLVDEEALLAVKQQRRRPCAAGRSRHAWHRTYNGKVIVPSWSVRRTLGGKPAASRPDDLDAISCVLVVIALCSSSGERRLRPPRGAGQRDGRKHHRRGGAVEAGESADVTKARRRDDDRVEPVLPRRKLGAKLVPQSRWTGTSIDEDRAARSPEQHRLPVADVHD